MNVAIGTDGQGFSDTSDYLEELRLADLLQRTPGPATRALAPRALLEMGTVNGARAFGRERTGTLTAGSVASLVLLDADRMTRPYAWPGHDPHALVLQRARADHVDTVISRGRVLMEQGQVLTVDATRAEQRLRDLYQIIWSSQSSERQALIDAVEPHVMGFYDSWIDLPTVPRYGYNRI